MAKYDFFHGKKISLFAKIINKKLYHKLWMLFFRILPKTANSVLEIGSGNGFFAYQCKRHGLKYKGYEPNNKMFQILQKQNFAMENTSIPPVTEPNNAFDGVLMLQVIEHMPTVQAAQESFEEVYRVLNENGILFLTCPNYLSWKEDFFDLDYTHQFITTRNRLEQMLNDTGFSSVEFDYYYGASFSAFGRFGNSFLRSIRNMASFFLPKHFIYSIKFRKMGMLLAENIVIIAKK